MSDKRRHDDDRRCCWPTEARALVWLAWVVIAVWAVGQALAVVRSVGEAYHLRKYEQEQQRQRQEQRP